MDADKVSDGREGRSQTILAGIRASDRRSQEDVKPQAVEVSQRGELKTLPRLPQNCGPLIASVSIADSETTILDVKGYYRSATVYIVNNTVSAATLTVHFRKQAAAAAITNAMLTNKSIDPNKPWIISGFALENTDHISAVSGTASAFTAFIFAERVK